MCVWLCLTKFQAGCISVMETWLPIYLYIKVAWNHFCKGIVGLCPRVWRAFYLGLCLCQILIEEDGSSTPQACDVLNHTSPYLANNTGELHSGCWLEVLLKNTATQPCSDLWWNKVMSMNDCRYSDLFLNLAWPLGSSISDVIWALSFHWIVLCRGTVVQCWCAAKTEKPQVPTPCICCCIQTMVPGLYLTCR